MASPQVHLAERPCRSLSGCQDMACIPGDLFTSSISHLSCNITLLKGLQHRSQCQQTQSKNCTPGRGCGYTSVIGHRKLLFFLRQFLLDKGTPPRTTPGLGLTCVFLVQNCQKLYSGQRHNQHRLSIRRTLKTTLFQTRNSKLKHANNHKCKLH